MRLLLILAASLLSLIGTAQAIEVTAHDTIITEQHYVRLTLDMVNTETLVVKDWEVGRIDSFTILGVTDETLVTTFNDGVSDKYALISTIDRGTLLTIVGEECSYIFLSKRMHNIIILTIELYKLEGKILKYDRP